MRSIRNVIMPGRSISGVAVFIFGMVMIVQGQIKDARKEMTLFNYSKAITDLQRSYKHGNEKSRDKAALLLAECYRKLNNAGEAKYWYSIVIRQYGTDPVNYYYYGQSLRSAGDYQSAKKMFHRYDSLVPTDPIGRANASFCDSAMLWQDRKALYEVWNAGLLNSPQSEFGVVPYDSGIIFTSDRKMPAKAGQTYGWTGNNYLQLFYAGSHAKALQPCDFSQPEVLSIPGKSNYHNGPASYDHLHHQIFINRTLQYPDAGRREEGKLRTHLLKIFISSRKNGKWSEAVPFFLNNDRYSVGHPALLPDGKRLYFVSDMPGGYGGTDIYCCTRTDDGWSEPENLGKVINTAGNEMFPFAGNDSTLFFASDGFPGFGGLDIFCSRFTNNQWTTPVNLGMPVNSSFDDFSLTSASGDSTGFFCSNRPGGMGGDDIYCFRTIRQKRVSSGQIPVYMTGFVRERSTGKPLPDATLFMLDKTREVVLIGKTDLQGFFKFQVRQGEQYTVKAEKFSFIPDCLSILPDFPAGVLETPIPRDLLLDKLEVNRIFKLENIYYDFDKWEIRHDAELSLNGLVKIMKENPVTVELGSHTDCRGGDEYNRILSQKRAESAVRFIISQGIPGDRIHAKGYGKSRLLNRCDCGKGVTCSEAEHQMNRRTEFKILSIAKESDPDAFHPENYHSGDTLLLQQLPIHFFDSCDQK